MIELDGSFGEGGGQILRSSLALSLLTGKPFRLRNIRARRPRPGLQPQHLMCVRAAAEIGRAGLRGASLHSSDLTFEPGEVAAGSYHFAIGTAGATALVLHTLYLPLALRGGGPSQVVISGGTHVKSAPCYHFLETTWRGYLELFGLRVKLRMNRPGFYPRGGGAIEAHIQPCAAPAGWTPAAAPAVARVGGFSAVAGLPEDIADRQAHRAAKGLRHHDRKLEVEIPTETWPGGPGTVLALTLDTEPVPTLFFALGERGKKAERVADEAVAEAVAYLEAGPGPEGAGGLVDPHSADQIVLPLALADGPSRFAVAAVTTHLTTNVAVIREFLDRDVSCAGVEGAPGVVTIR